MIKRTSLIMCFLINTFAAIGCSMAPAYLIVEAIDTDESAQQPKWIALSINDSWSQGPSEPSPVRRADYLSDRNSSIASAFLHVPAGESIVSIPPSSYRLAYVSFRQDRLSGDIARLSNPNTVSTQAPGAQQFTLRPNTIYFVGSIRLTKFGPLSYQVEIAPEQQVLQRACEKSPELFLQFPVRVLFDPNPEKEYRIDCGGGRLAEGLEVEQ